LKNAIKIFDNGKIIPADMLKDVEMHMPFISFGNLLTSSNYYDKE
jgi:hypothetical protein